MNIGKFTSQMFSKQPDQTVYKLNKIVEKLDANSSIDLSQIPGYDPEEVQILKNTNGVISWVDE